jgi:hypothetical protein
VVHEHLTPAPADSGTVKSCWLCGIRLAASQMVPDGGSACADIRWFCRDVRGCTERWTVRLAQRHAAPPGEPPARGRPGQAAH